MEVDTIVEINNKARSEHGDTGRIVKKNYGLVYYVKLDKNGTKIFHYSELESK